MPAGASAGVVRRGGHADVGSLARAAGTTLRTGWRTHSIFRRAHVPQMGKVFWVHFFRLENNMCQPVEKRAHASDLPVSAREAASLVMFGALPPPDVRPSSSHAAMATVGCPLEGIGSLRRGQIYLPTWRLGSALERACPASRRPWRPHPELVGGTPNRHSPIGYME